MSLNCSHELSECWALHKAQHGEGFEKFEVPVVCALAILNLPLEVLEIDLANLLEGERVSDETEGRLASSYELNTSLKKRN